MGENVRHFTTEQKDENTYGWPWNEVVKKYLESGYSSDQKECQVTIREKEYKILKRDAVTVFYDADGNTLFDVTNDRLKREYESDQGEEEENEEDSSFVEMGTASLVDAVTGNIPAPTPEEVETAKKANAGDVLAKAKQKLKEEVKEAKDKEFADPIIRHLLKRCEEDPGMAEDIIQDHKTWLKCFAYIRGQARKRAEGNCAVCATIWYMNGRRITSVWMTKHLRKKRRKSVRNRKQNGKQKRRRKKLDPENRKRKLTVKRMTEKRKLWSRRKRTTELRRIKSRKARCHCLICSRRR